MADYSITVPADGKSYTINVTSDPTCSGDDVTFEGTEGTTSQITKSGSTLTFAKNTGTDALSGVFKLTAKTPNTPEYYYGQAELTKSWSYTQNALEYVSHTLEVRFSGSIGTVSSPYSQVYLNSVNANGLLFISGGSSSIKDISKTTKYWEININGTIGSIGRAVIEITFKAVKGTTSILMTGGNAYTSGTAGGESVSGTVDVGHISEYVTIPSDGGFTNTSKTIQGVYIY